MKIVLRNSSVVYEEVQWTKVSKTDTSRANVTLGAASDFVGEHSLTAKVTIKSTPASPVNPIPTFYLALGQESDAGSVLQFLATTTDVAGTEGTIIKHTFNFNLSQSLVTDKYVKLGFSGSSYNQNQTLNTYIYDVEYVLE